MGPEKLDLVIASRREDVNCLMKLKGVWFSLCSVPFYSLLKNSFEKLLNGI